MPVSLGGEVRTQRWEGEEGGEVLGGCCFLFYQKEVAKATEERIQKPMDKKMDRRVCGSAKVRLSMSVLGGSCVNRTGRRTENTEPLPYGWLH